MSNIASLDPCLFIERIRCFIKWHEDRFDALDGPHEPMANPVGWTRGEEHWINPDTWRDTIFDGDEDAAQDAARTLRNLGLAERILRLQPDHDDRAYQAILRAKTAVLNGALTNQVRVDEVKLRTHQDEGRQATLERIAAKLLGPKE